MAVWAGALAVVVSSGKAPAPRGFADTLLVALCSFAVLASVGWLLKRDDSGVVGTNGVRPLGFVGVLPGQQEMCQTLGAAKRRPSTALVTLATGPAGPQPLRVRVPGEDNESLVDQYPDGVVELRLPPNIPPDPGRLLCIKNVGQRDVQLGGEDFPSAMVNRRTRPFAVSVTLIGSRRSWGAQAGMLLNHIGSARGARGSVTGWVVCGLFGAAILVALAGAWRTAR